MKAYLELRKIRDNLKKSIYRQIPRENLETKLAIAEQLKDCIEESLQENYLEIPTQEFNEICKKTRDIYREICEIINRKLANQKIPIMTESAFDLKMATALVQPYDGSPASLDAFVDSVNLLAELTTTPAHINVAVKFVKTRLSGRARSALPADVATLNAIVQAVKQHCESTETPDSVAAKLKALKPNGDTDKYLQSVEQLTAKLTSLYIKDNIPLNVATKMATKMGVESLVNKATDSDTRIIMKAAEFSSIQAAIQKFNESTSAPSAQILSTQSRKIHSNRGYPTRGNYNYNNRSGYRNTNHRQNQNGNQYQQRQYNQRQNSRGNYHQGRGNYQNQNRGQFHNQNQSYQGYNQGNARIYYTPAQMLPQNMHQQQSNTPIMTHSVSLPHVQPHPLGGTQGQYTQ